MNTLDKENSLLLVVDVQERLVNALEKDVVVKRVSTLTQVTKILEIPTLLTEQYPKGLGSTVETVKQNIGVSRIFEKTEFSALREEGFLEVLKSYGKKQIVVCGIETHVCVHQTVADLLLEGFDVYVVKDACASRNKYEFKQGIERMQDNGAKITCLEIVLFEWLKGAKNPKFKEIQALIK
jgi:nicotinamidase-related amidase